MAVLTEISLRLPNSPGALADICRLLATERVSILAFGLDPAGSVRLVVNNPTRATGALREMRHALSTRDVLVVSAGHGPDGFGPALGLLADAGVNVDYAYSGTGESRTPVLVVGVDDPVRAATIAGV